MSNQKRERILAGGGFLSINKIFLKHLGADMSCFLSILLEWHNYLIEKNKMPEDGYFFLEQVRIEKTIRLSSFQQRQILNSFKEWGFILAERRNIPPKYWYFINEDRLIQFFNYLNFKGLEIKGLNIKELNLYYNKTNFNNTNIDTNTSKEVFKRVSNETPNDSLIPRRKRTSRDRLQLQQKFRRKDIRKTSINHSIPGYVINIINQWNKNLSTTTHKLDLENPSKTIKSIHQYLTQLKTGKMSGLNSIWLKKNKIPNSFLTRKWTEEELCTGIEHLSKYSQNDYWPPNKINNPWIKSLPGLLYNSTQRNSLFLQVMNNPPKKLSEQKIINHPNMAALFIKANIWMDRTPPSECDVDRVLDGLFPFVREMKIKIKRMEGKVDPRSLNGSGRFTSMFWQRYIEFIETSSIVLNDAWQLNIKGWVFEKYLKDIWDQIQSDGSTLNPLIVLKKLLNNL